MKIPRILIAAGKSGSGKTTLTCGILQALKRRGRHPAAFKCGPDYIDPMFHRQVLKTPSRNLDAFFADRELLRWLLAEGAKGADLAVLEGVMGYYDGIGGASEKASSYDLACLTDTPAVLVLDGRGLALSAAAWLAGLCRFRPDSRIRGVIFNRMSAGVYRELKPLVEKELSLTCVGYVPENAAFALPSRHLGLILPHERENLSAQLNQIADVLEETLDLDVLCAIAESAGELETAVPGRIEALFARNDVRQIRVKRPVIAVARDEAFCFFYPENLELLQRLGAELVYVSPLHDRELPPHADGLLLYGGYPELYARQLAQNHSMLQSIRDALLSGVPCMAECGGYLYLSETLTDPEKNSWAMAGVLPGESHMGERLNHFGYIRLTANTPTAASWSREPLLAHEFHYYRHSCGGNAFHAEKPSGKRSWECICATDTLLAGFPHFYYPANPELAVRFLAKCCLESPGAS